MTKWSMFLLLGLAVAALGGGESVARAQNQLLLNGTFDTVVPLSAGTYSPNVGRSGSGAAYILVGTTGAGGWFTTQSDGLFEVWAPGFQGSPTGVGNTLELANSAAGKTIYQDVTTSAAGAATALFSFDYAARNSGQNQFTVSIVDQTTPATPLAQSFNPTAAFTVNTPFSFSFAITPGDVYRVAFLDQNTYSTGTEAAHIDNVSFLQSVPEPATWRLAGIGAGVVGLAARRRRLSGV